MNNEQAQLLFAATAADRINNLNERLTVIEEAVRMLVNLIAKTNIKSMHEPDDTGFL